MKKHKGVYQTSQGIKWNGSSYFRKRSADWRHKPTGRVVRTPTIANVLKSKTVEHTYNHPYSGDTFASKSRKEGHTEQKERNAFVRLRKA